MRDARRVAVALLSAALVAEVYSPDAAAIIVYADEFAVVKNGTTIFDDSFNRNTTLSGGNGTVLLSGTNFSDGTPASYFLQGSLPETTANNGQGAVQHRQRRLDRAGPECQPWHSNRNGPRRGARLDTGEYLLGNRLVRGTLSSIGDIPVVHRQQHEYPRSDPSSAGTPDGYWSRAAAPVAR